MRRNRKSQITVFIILAIVLLFSTALILYIREKITEEKKPLVFPSMEEVPIEMQPLQMFVVNCIERTGTEALNRMGLHGGYISLEPGDFNITKTFFNLDIAGIDPTEFDAVTFSPDSGWRVPYWYHLSADNDCAGDCTFAFNRPPLYRNEGDSSIENQLDRYVLANLKECLGDFNNFQNFNVREIGNLSVVSVVAAENVNLYIDYPLEVMGTEGSKKMQHFNSIIPLNLRRIYEIATEILNTQQRSRFLEGHTLNVVAAFAGLDKDKLPPLAETDFGYTPTIWSRTEVRKKLQDYLMIYTMRLQTRNTKNYFPYVFPQDSVKQGLYHNMELPLNGSYRDLAVEFTYLSWWPIYLDLGGHGEIVSSTQSAVGIFKFLPIRQYQTPYDISYPVIVEINDPAALNTKGYKFYFALEANIRNNNMINESFVPLRKATMGNSGQFCNQNQRNSGEITIETVDYNNNPVDNVAVFFTAQSTCLLGSTKIDGTGKSVFRGKFPIGIGAISLVHPDYAEHVQQYSTRLDKNDSIVAQLDKYRDVTVSARKYNLFKDIGSEDKRWSLDSSPKPLSGQEQVIIMMQKKKSYPSEDEFAAVAQISGEEETTMRLVPGIYDINVQLILYNTSVVIPEHEICTNVMLMEQCTDVPEINLGDKAFYAGNVEIKNWTLRSERFYDNYSMVFNAINFDLPSVPPSERTINDLEMMDKFANYTREHLALFNPKYVK